MAKPIYQAVQTLPADADAGLIAHALFEMVCSVEVKTGRRPDDFLVTVSPREATTGSGRQVELRLTTR